MQRRWWRLLVKLAAYALVAAAALAAAAITFTMGWRPVVGAKARAVDPARRFEPTPARLARGEYLVKGVVGCYECHTKTDATRDPPARVAPDGSGALFINQADLRVVAPNITPDRETGIGAWSDDALARAVREGIGHDGRTLFPAMPYPFFRHMSDEDLAAIYAYLRTLKPVRHRVDNSEPPTYCKVCGNRHGLGDRN
ncbi:MAG: cytochrome c [Acidobacteria bacterium]|nr:cytochrome c [Acidobacteriota bacterium]